MATETISPRSAPTESAPEQSLRLIDPTRYTWFYFKIPNPRDERPTAAELNDRLSEMVNQFQKEFFGETDQVAILLTDNGDRETPILSISRQLSIDFQVELELYQTLDVYVLAINIQAPGEFAADDLPTFPRLPFESKPANHFLGSFTVFQAETENGIVDLTTATKVLRQRYLPDPSKPSPIHDTGHAHIAFCSVGNETTEMGAAFAYPLQHTQPTNDDTPLTPAESQLLDDLPLLGLCHFKAVNSRRRLRLELHERLRDADQKLQSLLKGSFQKIGVASQAQTSIEKKLKAGNPSRLTLSELTEVSDELTNRRSELTDQSEAAKRELHTIDVNRKNLIELIRLWPSEKAVQDLVFEKIVRNPVAQAESDVQYAKSTLMRGEVFRDSLNASTTRREVRETRSVATWMGGLGAISASALIPAVMGVTYFESFPIGYRIVFVAIAPVTFVGWTAYSWWRRR